jgi:hypothetical protein
MQENATYTIRRILLFAEIKHWHPKAEQKENQDNQLHFSLLNISISIFLILAIALNS